jgi:hypothetical protein
MTEVTGTTGPAAADPAKSGGSRIRTALVALLLVLTCLALVATTVLVWTHRTLLVTDRFVAVTSRISEDPTVVAAVSDRVATQVVEGLDIEGRVAALLPDQADALAAVLAGRVREEVADRLNGLLSSERAQAAWSAVLRASHERLVPILRGEVLGSGTDPTVTIDVLPLVAEGIRILQEIGLVPADVQVPDVTDPSEREAAITRLEERLGRDLPPDFALVTITKPGALVTAQRAVRAFDIITIASVVLTVALAILTVVAARSRRRMVVYLGLGAAVSLALASILIAGIERGLVAAVAAENGRAVVQALYRDVTSDLASWVVILAVVGVVVALIAYLLGRPAWLSSGAEAVGVAGGTGAPAEASGETGSGAGASVGGWLGDNLVGLAAFIGLALAVVALWSFIGPGVAILAGVAAVGIWALLRRSDAA